jgi:hypothetical protein
VVEAEEGEHRNLCFSRPPAAHRFLQHPCPLVPHLLVAGPV